MKNKSKNKVINKGREYGTAIEVSFCFKFPHQRCPLRITLSQVFNLILRWLEDRWDRASPVFIHYPFVQYNVPGLKYGILIHVKNVRTEPGLAVSLSGGGGRLAVSLSAAASGHAPPAAAGRLLPVQSDQQLAGTTASSAHQQQRRQSAVISRQGANNRVPVSSVMDTDPNWIHTD